RRIGFFAGGKLKTVDIANGSVRALADAPLPRGGTWGRGIILYQPISLGPLWSVPDGGGEATVASHVDSSAGDIGHRFPQFLSDQSHFVCAVLSKGEDKIAVGELRGGPPHTLFRSSNGAGVTFAAPDWVISLREGVVKAQRLDAGASKLVGPAVELAGVR